VLQLCLSKTFPVCFSRPSPPLAQFYPDLAKKGSTLVLVDVDNGETRGVLQPAFGEWLFLMHVTPVASTLYPGSCQSCPTSCLLLLMLLYLQ
jgi:hypothetical protein